MRRVVLGIVATISLSACGDVAEPAVMDAYPDAEVSSTVTSPETIERVHSKLRDFGYFPNAKIARTDPSWVPVFPEAPQDWGRVDDLTVEAVKAFQADHGLPTTGVIDEELLLAMDNRWCGVPETGRSVQEKWALISSDLFPSTSIRYRVVNRGNLSQSQTNSAIAAAFSEWAAVTTLNFTRVTSGEDIRISFTTLDGALGRAEAHATPRRILLHSGREWTSHFLQGVTRHEIGHIIGVGHAPGYGTMHPQVGILADVYPLTNEDIVPANAAYGVWRQLPGEAFDIGVNGTGNVWITGTNDGIYKWDEAAWSWIRANGSAYRVTVDSSNVPWVVNANGEIFRRTSTSPTNGSWSKLPGCATDIGAGGGQVWIVGCNGTPYRYVASLGSPWQAVSGGASSIDVDRLGRPWIRNSSGNIYRRSGSSWELLPGGANDIGVGSERVGPLGGIDRFYPWIVGLSAVGGGYNIATFSEQAASGSGGSVVLARKGWVGVPGGARRIAVGSNGRPWIVNSSGKIYRRSRD